MYKSKKEVVSMSVGSRIKELRENKNMTRNELADSIGVTVGAVSNYENEVSSPKEPILFKIMETLKCDANYLFQDAIQMPSMKNSVSIDEFNIIEKYRALDTHGKEMVDFTLSKEWERSIELSEQATTDEEDIIEIQPHLLPNAAHESKKPFTSEERQEDENMLD